MKDSVGNNCGLFINISSQSVYNLKELNVAAVKQITQNYIHESIMKQLIYCFIR